MTDDEAKELEIDERICNAATAGPWWRKDGMGTVFGRTDNDDRVMVSAVSGIDDAAFIARARTRMPALLALVRERDAEIATLLKAMEPFVRLVKETNGNIPTERLSFANWHTLSKVYTKVTEGK